MNICLFTEEEINKPLDLKDERAQHLIKVLHKKEGDTFTAGIIGGKAGIARIEKIEVGSGAGAETGVAEKRGSGAAGAITFSFEPSSDGKLLNPVKMIIGFPRPIQLKRLLRDIAALGVYQVHLCGTDLGEKSYLQSTLVEKGNAYKMLLDGTVQAGSTHVPELYMHKTLDECLEVVEQSGSDDLREIIVGSVSPSFFAKKKIKLALDNVKPKCSLKEAIHTKKLFSDCDVSFCDYEVIAAIGSERGWTDRERDLLQKKGFTLCGMGPRIMRTETAATVAGAIILDEIGALK